MYVAAIRDKRRLHIQVTLYSYSICYIRSAIMLHTVKKVHIVMPGMLSTYIKVAERFTRRCYAAVPPARLLHMAIVMLPC